MGLNILFFGTPTFSVPILDSLHNDPDFHVTGVITAPDRPAGRGQKPKPPPVKEHARNLHLPVFQTATLKTPEIEVWLRTQPIDLIVVAAFGLIFPRSILELPRWGCLNVHSSLLPSYRGASPVAYAILHGDEQTGVSFMLMTEKMDAGPILFQEAIPIREKDTAGSLENRLSRLGAKRLPHVIKDYIAGRLKPRPQDESMATYAPKLVKSMGHIDWSRSATEIDRLIRAMNPWPKSYTGFRGKRIIILEVKPIPEPVNEATPPGTLLPYEQETLRVTTGEGILEIFNLQPEGKRTMNSKDFLHGYRPLPGERFEPYP